MAPPFDALHTDISNAFGSYSRFIEAISRQLSNGPKILTALTGSTETDILRRHGRVPRAPGEPQSTRPRATNQEIQKWISRHHGFVPESAWFAHCKDLFGLSAPGTSANENPCPLEKAAAIKQAFRHFELL